MSPDTGSSVPLPLSFVLHVEVLTEGRGSYARILVTSAVEDRSLARIASCWVGFSWLLGHGLGRRKSLFRRISGMFCPRSSYD